MRFKARIRQVHLWLSFAASVPLLILGFTGALLVFPLHSESFFTSADMLIDTGDAYLPPSRLIANIERELPEGNRVHRMQYPRTAGTAMVVNTTSHRVAINPYTGQVISKQSAKEGFMPIVLSLHTSLMISSLGHWLTGLTSIALFVLSVSGIWLWWPVGKWKRDYFRIKLRGGLNRFNFDLHRISGFYLSIILMLISGTGITMVFYSYISPIAYWLTWSSPSPEPHDLVVEPQGREMMSPDDILNLALQRYPQLEPHRLYVPASSSKPYRVFLDPPGEHEWRVHEVRMEIDPYTGHVLMEESPETMSRGDRLLRWILPLHFGTYGGVAIKWLYVVASLSPLVLAISGTSLWLRRSRKAARSRDLQREIRKARRKSQRQSESLETVCSS